MQSVSARIWTRVAVSISCNDNHYTTGTLYPPALELHYQMQFFLVDLIPYAEDTVSLF